MTTGRIDYAPDYKSEKPNPLNVIFEEGMRRQQVSAERARLERAIVEAAKQWATLRYQPHFGGMVALEDALQEATRALIEFESLQEKK